MNTRRRILTNSFLRRVVVLSALSVLVVSAAEARQDTGDPFEEPRESTFGFGGQILLTNSGFGVGAYVLRRVGIDYSLIAELSLSAGKDEREVAFFDRFGRKDIPNKANYLLLAPLRVGLEKRLFRSKIEDNFRPYLHFTAGPTFGWKYPYFRDINGNGHFDDDEPTFDTISALPKGNLEMGLGGTLAIGANFGALSGANQSVRIGYSFTYFFDKIELLERTIRKPAHFFGSPTILVSFGKLR